MNKCVYASLIALLSCSLAGCSSDSDKESETGWKGDELHLVANGRLNGNDVAINITPEQAADASQLWCVREYEAPLVNGTPDLTKARHIEVKLAGNATVNGEARMFEIEFKHHAMQSDKPGAEVAIVPRIDGQDPAANQMWFEWEWHTPEGDELIETAAQEGKLVLGKFSGSPGEGGVVIPQGEGQVGGFVDARWSVDEHISLSFTATCTKNKISEF